MGYRITSISMTHAEYDELSKLMIEKGCLNIPALFRIAMNEYAGYELFKPRGKIDFDTTKLATLLNEHFADKSTIDYKELAKLIQNTR